METIKSKLTSLKEDAKEIRIQVRKQTIGYILAGLGLVAGLAWNEAVKSLIEYLFPLEQNTLLARFIYAILVTLVVVAVSSYLAKLLKEEKK